jgi:hypothetical protein
MSSSSESRSAVTFLATAGRPPSTFSFLYAEPESRLEELALELGLGGYVRVGLTWEETRNVRFQGRVPNSVGFGVLKPLEVDAES